MSILPRESPTPLPMCAGPWVDFARAPAVRVETTVRSSSS
jgi:hypothetical protein